MVSPWLHIEKQTGRHYDGQAQTLEILVYANCCKLRDKTRNMRVYMEMPYDVIEMRKDSDFWTEYEIECTIFNWVMLAYDQGNYSEIYYSGMARYKAPSDWDADFDARVITAREEKENA